MNELATQPRIRPGGILGSGFARPDISLKTVVGCDLFKPPTLSA